VPNFFQIVGRSRKVVALFVLMVLLPAAVFTVLIVRATRSERARLEYDKTLRQRQIVRFIEADLRTWLFSAAGDSARSTAQVRFEAQDDRIVFPDFHLSWPASESPQLRPAEAGPPDLPPTARSVAEQYFPRIQAFRRDVAAGRNAGAQYFRQLRALVVQLPGSSDGYVVDIQHVLAHVNGKLAEFAAADAFTATAWMGAERTSRPPVGSFAIEGFPFLEVLFEDAPTATAGGLRGQALPYSMAVLLLVTVLGSVFAYRAVSQEARLARLRNDFVAAVSHEFRSPLSSILALAERLERIQDPEKLREYHRIIGQDAHRLRALVTRLLDFALIEEGKKVYSLERIDLVAAAREAIDSCQHVAHAERIRLFGADAPLWVHADRTALHHAIQNVIENAAKYSPPESPIIVQCASANGNHLVEVRDRGVGPPPAEQAKIFEKFYRGRHASGLNVQGVGIGLALVRHVVDSHGGSISVESRPGDGSRFSLRFPKAEA
jgi:two-component system phosphate regulon sensor histidine kinase PhoR